MKKAFLIFAEILLLVVLTPVLALPVQLTISILLAPICSIYYLLLLACFVVVALDTALLFRLRLWPYNVYVKVAIGYSLLLISVVMMFMTALASLRAA